MSTYKKLNRQDVYVSDYVARKQWHATGSLLTDYGIDILRGFSSSLDHYPNDYFNGRSQELVWKSINHLYYKDSIGDNIYSGSNEHYRQSSLSKTGSRLIDDEVTVISIPKNVFGTHIDKHNFVLTPDASSKYILDDYVVDFNTGVSEYTENLTSLFGAKGIDLTDYLVDEGDYVDEETDGQYVEIDTDQQRIEIIDDGEGNLIFSGSDEYYTKPERILGDVIYTHGQVIITDKDIARYYSTFIDPSLSWKANQPIYTYNVHCTVRESELNHTFNPSAISGSENNVKANLTGSKFKPYVTSVGLYNEANELIAVAKMNRPIPKSQNVDMTFVIKLDI